VARVARLRYTLGRRDSAIRFWRVRQLCAPLVYECMATPFPTIVEDLYVGTLDDAAWRRAILAVADAVRARGAVLFAFNSASGHVLRDEIYRLPRALVLEYARCWATQDFRVRYASSIPVGRPFTEVTLAIPKWKQTPILNEFLIPNDAPHIMPVWLHKSPTKTVALTLQGSCKRGSFESVDIEIFQQLIPHIHRALEIRDRLENAQIRADTLTRALDVITFGVVVLDSLGKIIEANAVAQELMCKSGGIGRKPDGTLCLRQPAGAELNRWIATGQPAGHGADAVLRVPRADAPPLSVVLAPLLAAPTAWIGGDPRWLLLIFDPDRRVQTCSELIARDLAISACEAELAALLVSGYGLVDAASKLQLSKHTVRNQLKSIFRKTGIRSQVELVRRVVLGPSGCNLKPEVS
jgi:DNA-binding CsgD family transcriptional regulator